MRRLAVLTVAGLLFGACAAPQAAPPTATQVVDAAGSDLVEASCSLVALAGLMEVSVEDLYQSFADGYGDGPPSPRLVWNEILRRCPR